VTAVRCRILLGLLALMAATCGCEEALPLAATGPAPRPITPPEPEAIQDAIDRGVAFLLETQWQNGSWGSAHAKPMSVLCPVPGGHMSFKAGTTALCIMALLEAGGDSAEVTAALDSAEQWLLDQLPAVRRDSIKTLYNGWAHAYGLQAALRLAQRPGASPERRAELLDLARLQIHLLSRYQSLGGGWGYYQDRGSYVSSRPNIPGTSFLTATIMVALHEARTAGLDVPDRMILLARRALNHSRSPDGSYEYYSYPTIKLPMLKLNRPPAALGRVQVCNLAMFL